MNWIQVLIIWMVWATCSTAQTPSFLWAKEQGNSNSNQGRAVTTDLAGNVYTTGWFEGTVDFDPNAGVTNLTAQGEEDIFIQKLDSIGNLLWVRQIGSTQYDQGRGIAIDSSGNSYIVGGFEGTVDFDPSSASFNLTSSNNSIDAFVLKLDPAGNFVWARQVGGIGLDIFSSLALAKNAVYITGSFVNTADFDPGVGVENRTSAGSQDAFVLKLDANGTFVWVRQLGGTGSDIGYGIAVSNVGNVHLAGAFRASVDFDPSANNLLLTSAGDYDGFIQKLDPNGNLLWAKQLRGTGRNQLLAITTDANEQVYATGSFANTADFDPNSGTLNMTATGGLDAFVQKLDAMGNLIWAKQFGGTTTDLGFALQVDASGSVYTTGSFQNTVDFDPNAGTFNLSTSGGQDIFLQILDLNGILTWAGKMGAAGNDIGIGIALDPQQNIYTTGSFQNTVDFDPNAGTFNLSTTNQAIFIQKLGAINPIILSTTLSYFEATRQTNQAVLLEWQLANVDQVAELVIEKYNGHLFETVANLERLESAYTDFNSNNGVSYYRIKFIALDQTISYSAIVAVKGSNLSTQLYCYPTPTKDYLYINSNNHLPTNKSTIELLNMSGQVLKTWVCPDKAATTQPLDLRDIPKGVYVIRLLQGDRNYTQTIVKQ